MALNVYSQFFYGHKVDSTNNVINFKEGAGPEKVATLPVGSYTLTKFLEIVAAALNTASALDWTVSVNRSTGIVTIVSSDTASLMFGTGSSYFYSPALLLGFPQTDILNQTSFVGSSRSGYVFAVQFPIQKYLPKDKNKKLINAVVTKSATGDSVSVQNFGVERFIKGDIQWITNEPTEGKLRFNSRGVEDAQAFLDYIVEKHPIEFIEDEKDPNTFDKVYLDNTEKNQDGTGHELTEYTDRNLPGYFGTGLLSFKVINIE